MSESTIKAFNKKELKQLEKQEISSWSTNTRGHHMEYKVDVLGERSINIDIKNIIFEADAFDKRTKTLTEIKSNFGTKVYAIERAFDKIAKIYWTQKLTNSRKIKNFIIVGINSKITRKYGMDYSEFYISVEDLNNRNFPKQRGVDFAELFDYQKEIAENTLRKIEAINKKEV
jgi:hypothetical protein